MADVRPFRGLRYNPGAIGDVALVVAPPYDVIDDAARDAFYNKHPYNVIRLVLNRPKKSDTRPDQPYERAGEFLEQWLKQRIIVQDPDPCIYLYRQRYFIEGKYRECTGLIARVRVEEFESGVVRPHEDIMPKPLEDRTRLLEHTSANLDLVQALYSDPPEKLKKPILAEMERFPAVQFQTPDGMAHDVWAVSDERFISRVTQFLAGRSLYIADGHHRYQTSLEYSKRLRERGVITGDDDPRNFIQMMIVEMENPGLSLLPVHRVVLSSAVTDTEALIGRLEEWFNISPVEVAAGARSGKVFQLLDRVAESGRTGRCFGAFAKEPDRMLILEWKPGLDVLREVEGDYSTDYKNLDVAVLHRIVIEGVLGVPPERAAVEQSLSFRRDPLEAARMVDSGEGSIAFFVNPTRVEQVRDVADHGEKMPQKSTYFHPKPSSGVVMNRVTEW